MSARGAECIYIFQTPAACARIAITYTHLRSRFYGVMVSTLDSDSNDPGSNPGRTCTLFVCFEFLVLVKKNKTNKTVGWRVHHKQKVRRPGIEPGSKRWQRSIITTRPSAPSVNSEPLVVPAASDHSFVCFFCDTKKESCDRIIAQTKVLYTRHFPIQCSQSELWR